MTDMLPFAVNNARRVALRFESFPERARARLQEAIQRLTAELEARVLAAEPDRTGKLRKETVSFVDSQQDFIRGRVRVLVDKNAGGSKRGGSDAGKVMALEYGSHRSVKVSSYSQQRNQVFGRAVSPRAVIVDAYSRTTDIVAHNFLRGPLESMRPEIMTQLRAALVEAEAEGV